MVEYNYDGWLAKKVIIGEWLIYEKVYYNINNNIFNIFFDKLW